MARLCFLTYVLPKDKRLAQKIISSQIPMSDQDGSSTYPNDHDVLGDCHLHGKYNKLNPILLELLTRAKIQDFCIHTK